MLLCVSAVVVFESRARIQVDTFWPKHFLNDGCSLTHQDPQSSESFIFFCNINVFHA